MADDSPIMRSLKTAFDEFKQYAGSDGIAKGEEVDNFMKANFSEIMKNPRDPDVSKKLIAAVEALKPTGIGLSEFVDLYCDLVKAYAKDKIGVADKPKTETQ
ncbi:uncharacterized protein ACNLHF_026776 [Anomaloglossus baeobatrachus]